MSTRPARLPRLVHLLTRAAARRLRAEDGNAAVEFIGWTVVIVIPVVYLLIALAQVQASSFATVSAVDAAARVLEVDASAEALDRARLAAGLSLADQGVPVPAGEALSVTCDPAGCQAGAVVRVDVGVAQPLLDALSEDVVHLHAERAVTLASQGAP